MNSDTAASTTQPDGAPQALPELNMAVLDDAQVGQLFQDLEACAQIFQIVPKYAARGQVAESANLTLAEARDLLASHALRALQIRYLHDDAEWWDTLMLVGGQVRLVRIRHDLADAQAGAPHTPQA